MITFNRTVINILKHWEAACGTDWHVQLVLIIKQWQCLQCSICIIKYTKATHLEWKVSVFFPWNL